MFSAGLFMFIDRFVLLNSISSAAEDASERAAAAAPTLPPVMDSDEQPVAVTDNFTIEYGESEDSGFAYDILAGRRHT